MAVWSKNGMKSVEFIKVGADACRKRQALLMACE